MSKHMSALAVVDPVLTGLAYGYKNAALVGEALFPIVNVDKLTGVVPTFGKERFMQYETKRAPGANSNRKRITTEGTIEIALKEHDIEEPIDWTENVQAMFPRQKIAAKNVQTIIMMRHERRVAALARATASYAEANRVTLTGTNQWTDTGSSPLTQIETGKEAIRNKIGVEPNVMMIGHDSWRVLKRHAQLLALFQYSERAIMTLQHLADAVGIQKIVVGGAATASDAGVFSSIWGDDVVLAYVPEAASAEDRDTGEPSFGYTFRLRNGLYVDRYLDGGGKIEVIRCTDVLTEKIVGAEAGYLIKDTNAT